MHACVIVDLLVVETESLYIQVRLLALFIGFSTKSGTDIASAGGQCCDNL